LKGLTAQVPIIEPEKIHKYNTKTAQTHKTNTRQKENNIAGKEI
jgi:hypothetical protein